MKDSLIQAGGICDALEKEGRDLNSGFTDY